MSQKSEKIKKVIKHIENNYASRVLIRDTYLNLIALFDEIESGSHKVVPCCTIDGLKHCIKAFEDTEIYYDAPEKHENILRECNDELVDRVRLLQDENDKLQASVSHYKSMYYGKRAGGKQISYDMGYEEGFDNALDIAAKHLEEQEYLKTPHIVRSLKSKNPKKLKSAEAKMPPGASIWNDEDIERLDRAIDRDD